MAEINTEKKEKEYKDEYVIINLATEYHGYTGDISYAIVTDLSEKEFLANFGEETKSFRPCIYLTGKMYSAFHDYDKNEHREHTREGDYHDAFAFESSALLLVDEMANPARICESKFTLACIFKKLHLQALCNWVHGKRNCSSRGRFPLVSSRKYCQSQAKGS